MKDTLEWEDAPQPALIKVLKVGNSAAVLVLRVPGGKWLSVLSVEPVESGSLADAMEKSEALARQWRGGVS